MARPPRISVVVASYNSRATIGRCLESLRGQEDAPPFEVIVVDSSSDGTDQLVAGDFPEVHLHRLLGRRFPGQARNAGVALARGRTVAFTDADCEPAPTWLARIATAHDAGHELVGGAVANANRRSYIGAAYALSAFSRWLPGTPAGPGRDLAGGCLSVGRAVFDECGGFPDDRYSSDTAFVWRAARLGYTPVFDPALTVSHVGVDRLAIFVSRRLAQGRAFARMRAEEDGFSLRHAAAFALLAPLLPALLFTRVARRVLATRSHRRDFLRVAPLVLVGCVLWAAGESAGYAGHVARHLRPRPSTALSEPSRG